MSLDPVHLWQEMGIAAKAVFLLLLLMGVSALYVGIERAVTFWKARAQSRALAEALTVHFAKGDVRGGLVTCQKVEFKNAYLGHLMEAGLKEIADRFDRFGVEAAKRAMDRKAIQENADLRRGMNILATVGSTSPFVGLVGTIIGIINAFVGMAESGSGGLSSVSAGIAEALVTTAVGIAVAIVGVWLFNFFTSRIEAITNDITVSVQELIDWSEKQLALKGDTGPDAPTQEAHAK